jgi:hypothetical protein
VKRETSNVKRETSNVKRETAKVKPEVYDSMGRVIATLIDDQLKAGSYVYSWNELEYTSGMYFLRIRFRKFFRGLQGCFLSNSCFELLHCPQNRIFWLKSSIRDKCHPFIRLEISMKIN